MAPAGCGTATDADPPGHPGPGPGTIEAKPHTRTHAPSRRHTQRPLANQARREGTARPYCTVSPPPRPAAPRRRRRRGCGRGERGGAAATPLGHGAAPGSPRGRRGDAPAGTADPHAVRTPPIRHRSPCPRPEPPPGWVCRTGTVAVRVAVATGASGGSRASARDGKGGSGAGCAAPALAAPSKARNRQPKVGLTAPFRKGAVIPYRTLLEGCGIALTAPFWKGAVSCVSTDVRAWWLECCTFQ